MGVHEIDWRIAGTAGRTSAIAAKIDATTGKVFVIGGRMGVTGVGRQEPVPVNESIWTVGSAITARASAAGWVRAARTEAPTRKARFAAVGESLRGAGVEERGGVVLGAGVAAGVADGNLGCYTGAVPT